jgi:hypothetical protein
MYEQLFEIYERREEDTGNDDGVDGAKHQVSY